MLTHSGIFACGSAASDSIVKTKTKSRIGSDHCQGQRQGPVIANMEHMNRQRFRMKEISLALSITIALTFFRNMNLTSLTYVVK